MDYLRNKVIVEQAETFLAELGKNVKSSREALAFTIGQKLEEDFQTADSGIPFLTISMTLDEILKLSFERNPDWAKINSAVEIFKAKIDEESSGYYPQVAILAKFNMNFSSYDYGMVNEDNKNLLMVGVGVQYPIFSGFGTDARVEQSEAQYKKINHDKLFVQDALALRTKDAYYKVLSAAEQVEKTAAAKETARENRELTERAFQQELAEADDLVQAQIMEALVTAQNFLALYEHLNACAVLEVISGSNLQ